MCGIIHCKQLRKNRLANNLVMKRYQKQKARGTEGYGYIELKNGYVVAEVRTQTEKEILEKLTKSTADEIMFHHRFPTSTPNVIESTHPIKVASPKLKYNYYVMHNGIISNDEELREQHIKDGYKYNTDMTKKWITTKNTYIEEELWNDSEALAIDIAQAIETNKEITARGSIAVIVLQYEKTTGKAIALYYGRNNGNPLCVEDTKDFISLSSESGKSMLSDTLCRYDYITGKTTVEKKEIGKYTSYGLPAYRDEFDWKDYRTNKYAGEDDEEEDFQTGEWTEKETLLDLIDEAYNTGDYDTAQELEYDLQLLNDKEANKKKNKTKW
jgi:glucosamine 6-phosphate synthetase-like amidotransferase/phosphosugar isomerase protein